MLRKWLTFGLTPEQENRYRSVHLPDDLSQAKMGIWLVFCAFAGFVFVDYKLFRWSWPFYSLTALRVVFLIFTLWMLHFVRKVKSYRSYDRGEFIWGLAVISTTFAIISTRPQAFIVHVIVVIVAIFITLLVIPNKFTNQIFVSLVFAGGEALIVAPNLWAGASKEFLSVFLSIILATAFAISTSWHLHSLRRREFLAREEEQRLLAERTRTQEELRQQREWFRVTLTSIGDAVIATDVTGRITFMNRIAEVLTGWNLGEAAQRPLTEVFHIINEQTRQKVENPVHKVLEKGNIVGLANHTLLVQSDGTEMPIDDSGAPIRDLNGQTVGVVFVFRDITERRNSEHALRESEAKANALIKYAPTGIFEIDYRGPSFINVNDAMCQILGYGREELFSMGPAALLDDNSRALFADGIRRQLAGERIEETVEYLVRKKDGTFINAILNVSVNLAGNDPGRALVVAHDVTERKRMEEELKRSRDELELRVRKRTEQLRHLSYQLLTVQERERREIAKDVHDSLGQSLAALKFRIENTIRELRREGDQYVRNSLEQIIPLAQASIDEARRIQTGLRPPILDDLGILPTLTWFCREFMKTYPAIRVDKQTDVVESEVPDTLKTVIYRITQEAMNNIAKYSGTDFVDLSLRKAAGRIKLRIQDNGQGFDPQKVPTGEDGKRGLGLTSMRERAELSGGSFHIESAMGKGTAVQVSWPLA